MSDLYTTPPFFGLAEVGRKIICNGRMLSLDATPLFAV